MRSLLLLAVLLALASRALGATCVTYPRSGSNICECESESITGPYCNLTAANTCNNFGTVIPSAYEPPFCDCLITRGNFPYSDPSNDFPVGVLSVNLTFTNYTTNYSSSQPGECNDCGTNDYQTIQNILAEVLAADIIINGGLVPSSPSRYWYASSANQFPAYYQAKWENFPTWPACRICSLAGPRVPPVYTGFDDPGYYFWDVPNTCHTNVRSDIFSSNTRPMCNSDGKCTGLCFPGYDGEYCDRCLPNRYPYKLVVDSDATYGLYTAAIPNAGCFRYCLANETCTNAGTCDSNGLCVCNTTDAVSRNQANCECNKDYYGDLCQPCPGVTHFNVSCGGVGICSNTTLGNGTCDCPSPYTGAGCQNLQILSYSPTEFAAEGGGDSNLILSIDGTFLMTPNGTVFPTVLVGGSPALPLADGDRMQCVVDTALSGRHSVKCRIGLVPYTLSNGSSISVTVVRSDGARQSFTLPVRAPAITSLSVSSGITQGGYNMTIAGTSFGDLPATTVLLGDVVVPVLERVFPALGNFTTFPAITVRLVVSIPPGIGLNLPVYVSTGVYRTANNFTFSYNLPTVTLTTPQNGPTNGGYYLTIVGTNFGPTITPDYLTVSIDSRACPIDAGSRNHTFARCLVPSNVKRSAALSITVAIVSQAFSFGFDYDPLVLSNVTGCPVTPVSFPLSTANCATSGGAVITLNGANFGSGSDFLSLSCSLCASLSLSVPHEQALCTLFDNVGLNLPVTIRRASDSSAPAGVFVSYRQPFFDADSLVLSASLAAAQERPFGPSTGSASVVLPTALGGQFLSFTGTFYSIPSAPSNFATNVSVNYGRPRPPSAAYSTGAASGLYACSVLFANSSLIVCQTAAGWGREWVFEAFVYGVPTFTVSAFSASYPAPTITANTIQITESPFPQSAVVGSLGFGTVVSFDGTHFGDFSVFSTRLLRVQYGASIDAATLDDCTILPTSTNTRLSCRTGTQPSENSTDLRFFLIAGYDAAATSPLAPSANQYVVEGTDTYSYPVKPVLSTVRGCTTSGNATINCPTNITDFAGQAINLTLTGARFTKGLQTVFVGQFPCSPVTYPAGLESSTLTCPLPAAAGSGLLVSITSFSGLSSGLDKPLVSFAPPTVDALVGCSQVGQAIQCPRDGNIPVTIVGQNFGASGASVFIGSSTCTGVVHDATTPHSKLTCTLPPGAGLLVPVTVLQLLGTVSPASLTINYAQCPAGTRGLIDGTTTCLNCTAGQYSQANSLSCLPCAAGTYTNTSGTSSCTACPAGSFSADGASECTNCPFGFFASSNFTQYTCSACPVGTFANTTGSTGCVACSPGTFASAAARNCSECPVATYAQISRATGCISCQPGKFANVTGLSQCYDCEPGSISAGVDSVNCSKCAPGFAALSAGSSQCLPCEQGKYSGAAGSSVCETCGAGNFSSTAASVCSRCDAGRFSGSNSGPAGCSLCPAGQFSNFSTGACVFCSAGSFSLGGAVNCTLCAPGTYTELTGATTCTQCPAGSECPSVGAINHVPCGSGNYSGPQAAACLRCAPGTRSSGSQSSTTCLSCSPGSFSNVSSDACSQCPAGSFSLGTSVNCTLCPIGSFAGSSSSSQCDACPPGSACPEPGTVTPVPCGAGNFSTGSAAECSPCLPGTRSRSSSASSTCVQCRAGTFSNTSTDTCSPCAAGSFSFTGAPNCTLCEPGFTAIADGATTCSACAAGTVSPFPGRSVVCSQCPAGKYSGGAASECTECETGRYSPSPGATSCLGCEPGFFANVTGLSGCFKCAIGNFSSSAVSACEPCPTGRFAPNEGTSSCSFCSPGSFASSTTSATCDKCPAGTFSQTGRTNCSLCDVGRFNNIEGQAECQLCGEGTFANRTGLTACFECPIGFYQGSIGQSRCIGCEVGRFAQETRRTSCQLCAAGELQNRTNASFCDKCPAGYASVYQGATFCTACEKGKFSPIAGSPTCAACTGRTVALLQGSTTCSECQANGQPTPDGSSCVCSAGYYLNNKDETVDASTSNTVGCIPCPSGTDCSQPGSTYYTLVTLQGWWRANNDTLAYHECLVPQHCDGGMASSCGPNREGVLCALCKEGYRALTLGSTCSKCPDQGASAGVVVVVVGVLAGILCTLFFIIIRSDAKREQDLEDESWETFDANRELSKGEGLTPAGSTANLSGADLAGSSAALTGAAAAGAAGAAFAGAEVSNAPVVSLTSRVRPNITYKLKIAITFLQIATNVAFLVDIPWPSDFKTFISAFSFITLDFVPWQSVGCVALLDYYERILVLTLVPMGILLGLLLFYLLPVSLLIRFDMRDNSAKRKAYAANRRRFWKLVLFTVFLLYPAVCANVLGMFICKSVDGVTYMVKDFSLLCFDSSWYNFLPVAVIMTIIYPLGVPLAFFIVLFHFRDRLPDPSMRVQLGFLYEAYESKFWFFEVVDMAFKLFLTSLLAFFPPRYQMPIGMGAIIIYTLIILWFRPYIRRGDDRLALLCNTELYLILLCGYIFSEEREKGNSISTFTDKALSAVLITITILFILAFIAMAFKTFRKFQVWWVRQRKIRQHDEQTEDFGKLQRPRDGKGPIIVMQSNPLTVPEPAPKPAASDAGLELQDLKHSRNPSQAMLPMGGVRSSNPAPVSPMAPLIGVVPPSPSASPSAAPPAPAVPIEAPPALSGANPLSQAPVAPVNQFVPAEFTLEQFVRPSIS